VITLGSTLFKEELNKLPSGTGRCVKWEAILHHVSNLTRELFMNKYRDLEPNLILASRGHTTVSSSADKAILSSIPLQVIPFTHLIRAKRPVEGEVQIILSDHPGYSVQLLFTEGKDCWKLGHKHAHTSYQNMIRLALPTQ
jgi:hypothetical protein